MFYFDTSYLVRLYYPDRGFERVRQVAATDHLVSSVLGRIETVSALHRKLREGALTSAEFRAVIHLFQSEADSIHWISMSGAILERSSSVYLTLPSNNYLRAADAVHLSSAAEYGFTQVYSNDRHLVAAAPHFGLAGVDVIP